MEYLDGETLHDNLLRRGRRLTIAQVLGCGIQLATFISQMHAAGWAWRDCKPKNMIVTRAGRLVPIDFEGAAPIDRPDPWRWGTPGFTPPESPGRKVGNGVTDDLYALGSILFLLLTGRVSRPGSTCLNSKAAQKRPTSSLSTRGIAACYRAGENTCGRSSSGEPDFYLPEFETADEPAGCEGSLTSLANSANLGSARSRSNMGA